VIGKANMIETIWTYRVKAEKRTEFETRYAPDGDWARLFSRAAGYRGTELLGDIVDPARYATVDRWDDIASIDNFKQEFAAAYEELDKACEELTESEEHVGVFETL
jgi:heme-degrading monooxygenase HmoA